MRNPWLCICIVATLGLVGLTGMVGGLALAFQGREMPQSVVAIVGMAIGSLASFLVSPPRGSVGMPTDSVERLEEKVATADRHAKANEQHAIALREAVARLQGQMTPSPPAAPKESPP